MFTFVRNGNWFVNNQILYLFRLWYRLCIYHAALLCSCVLAFCKLSFSLPSHCCHLFFKRVSYSLSVETSEAGTSNLNGFDIHRSQLPTLHVGSLEHCISARLLVLSIFYEFKVSALGNDPKTWFKYKSAFMNKAPAGLPYWYVKQVDLYIAYVHYRFDLLAV